jgi:hypothetical protein
MKTKTVLLTLLLMMITMGCEQDAGKKDCGCNNSTVLSNVTYDNFNGRVYRAQLFFDTLRHNNAWFISVNFPDSFSVGGVPQEALLKICNVDLPAISTITDTLTSKFRGTSILFSGKLKALSPGEDFVGVQIPESHISQSYIIIDSLKKN